MPHDAKVVTLRTDFLTIQLLVNRSRGSVGVHAQLVGAEKAVLDRVGLGVFLVAEVAGEREPVGGVPVLR